jgi:hypothetical protein
MTQRARQWFRDDWVFAQTDGRYRPITGIMEEVVAPVITVGEIQYGIHTMRLRVEGGGD